LDGVAGACKFSGIEYTEEHAVLGVVPFSLSRGILITGRVRASMVAMEIKGRVHQGMVLPEEGQVLPEGAVVSIIFEVEHQSGDAQGVQRVTLPLVKSSRPGSLRLTGDDVAAALDEEDLAS